MNLTKTNIKRMYVIDSKLVNDEECTDEELGFYNAHFELMCEDRGVEWLNCDNHKSK